MKKLQTISILFMLFIASLAFTSCNENLEQEVHEEGVNKEATLAKLQDNLFKIEDLEKLLHNNKNSKELDLNNELKNKLYALLEDSKELFKVYDINDEDLKLEFGEENDPKIILVGLAILYSETDSNTNLRSRSNEIATCVGRALGIQAFTSLFAGQVSRTAILGAFRKVASRTLGWIGVGIAANDFGCCMGYWSNSLCGTDAGNGEDTNSGSGTSLN